MTYLKWIILLISVGCVSAPHIEPCDIINGTVAQCVPTDAKKPVYDKPVRRMRGYRCYSPNDRVKIKSWVQSLLDNMD